MEEKSSLKIYILGGLFRALVLTLVLLIVYSLAVTFLSVPEKATYVFTMIITLISIMYGSIYAAKKAQRKGWIVGLILAFFYMIIIFILSLIMGRGFSFSTKDLIKFSLAMLVGIFSGMLGINI